MGATIKVLGPVTSQTRITFSSRGEFRKIVSERVEAYFRQHGLRSTGNWRMYIKTAIILIGLAASYAALVFFANSVLTAVVAAFFFAQGLILVGLNIMHDGNHGSYSDNKLINKIMGFALDLIGGSNFVWRHKHNILHHTYTNVHGADEDLHTGGLLRLSPNQDKHRWHRYQHFYAFVLYSFLTLTWVTVVDLRRFFTRSIFNYRIPRVTVGDWVVLGAAKAIYFGYMIVVPSHFHPFTHVVVAFVGIHVLQGLTLSLVFQLAHAMEENSFPNPNGEPRAIEKEWAVHEVEATANFAIGNRLATWYLGGLNHQIEHHLFPRVCHIHYPAISKIVRATCEELSVSYVNYPTISSAVISHYRYLRALG